MTGEPPRPHEDEAVPALQVLFQDEHFVAIFKPAGRIVHRTRFESKAPPILQQLGQQIGEHLYPVHRLDRPAAGILIFALSSEASSRLCAAFAERTVGKRYLAVVRGYTAAEETIDYPLFDRDHDKQKEAQTWYRTLATVEVPEPVGRYQTGRFSLVEAIPHTGRFHQIRRHFEHICHPIIGDTSHGDGYQNRFFRQRFNSRELLLLSRRLEFAHPFRDEMVRLTAPLPPSWRELFAQLGWDHALVEV